MKHYVSIIAVVIFTSICLGIDKPTTEIKPEGCVTAECHANVKRHNVIHGPVNVNACDACHTLVDVQLHTYEPARDKAETCTFCHVVEVPEGATMHEPLVTRDCTGCHDPHGGFDRNSLKKPSMNELCASCHQDVTADMQFVHGPVAAGACGMCHEPHASANPKLLVETGRDLCIACHSEMEQLRQALDQAKAGHRQFKSPPPPMAGFLHSSAPLNRRHYRSLPKPSLFFR